MDKKDIALLISQGEGYNLEFKESYSDSISKEICSFANANGGKIILGVKDNKQIKGVVITNKLKSQIYDLVRNFDPKIEVLIEEIGSLLVISVPEGKEKPYSVNGKFYVRQGTNSQQLSRDEIREFFQKEGLVLFDEKFNYEFNLNKDINKKAYELFIERLSLTNPINMQNVLRNLELTNGKFIKNAGVLLFCKNIKKFFANATITCVLFQGISKVDILDRKEFDTDIHSNYHNTIDYIKTKLNTEYIIKEGPRKEVLEIPERALREALLNAIAHRNYFSNADIQVYIFKDRIEITNPGGLVSGIKISDLGKKSLSRNKLLFGLMQRMGLVEKIGSGIQRIRESMLEYKLKQPKFDVDENWFTITFYRPNLQVESFKIRNAPVKFHRKEDFSRELGVKLGVKLGVNEAKILNAIKENKFITITELSEKIKISTTAVENNLNKLKNKEAISRIGPDKSGYWQVLNGKL